VKAAVGSESEEGAEVAACMASVKAAATVQMVQLLPIVVFLIQVPLYNIFYQIIF